MDNKATNKVIILVRGMENETYPHFKKRIMDWASKVSQDVDSLKVSLTSSSPPKGSVIPFSKKKIAAVSFCNTGPEIEMPEIEGFVGSYKVTEALPVKYEKDWQDLEPTPGICLLTLFRQKSGLEWDQFIKRWYQGHTPLSLRIHPLWNYNRNVVESRSDENQPFDGIVEEQFRSSTDLTSPVIFFGGKLLLVPFRMLQVYFDVKGFIDYSSIETYWAEEIHIKS